MRLQVGGLVEEHPKEEVGVEVAVDRNLVKRVVGTRPAVVAQLRCPLTGDVEVYLVAVQVFIDPVNTRCRQMICKDAPVFIFLCQNEGQSQLLRLCLCILALLPQAVKATLAMSSNAISRRIVFRFIPQVTRKNFF